MSVEPQTVGRWSSAPTSGDVQRITRARLQLILDTVAGEHCAASAGQLPELVAGLIDADVSSVLWLTLSVLRAEFPDVMEIEHARRTLRLDGARAVVTGELARLADRPGPFERVQVIADVVTVDVHHTSSSEYISGIQRVVHETVGRWIGRHEFYPVAWTSGFRAFRPLSDTEFAQMFGDGARSGSGAVTDDVVWVPWRGRHVLPELGAEPGRSRRLRALGAFSGTEVAAIGYDCIAITSSETVAVGMGGLFAGYLTALRHAARVATISVSSMTEFTGWRRMARAAGFPGPDLHEISLAVSAQRPSPGQLAAGRKRLAVPGLDMVLVVGSHEPRKNHLAILHAAEQLWRDGVPFNLVFVGTGSWGADAFHATAAHLATAGRQIEVAVGLPDELLWAAYSLARLVVFPSLNEGFGLPIAESLAAGTPVIASDFGSMREIIAPSGAPLGGVLVDPYDDASIAHGMRLMLTDDRAYHQARAAAAQRSGRSWDEYASLTWDYLVSGRRAK